MQRAEHPRHIASQLSHGLHAFDVACCLAFGAAIGDVPVLGGDDRHIHDLERHLQALECSGSATASADSDDGGGFAPQIGSAAIESALHDAEECAVGLSVIDRRAEDEAIDRSELITDLIADIVIEDAAFVSVGESFPSHFVAAAASGTSANGFIANPYYFGLQTLIVQGLSHFFQRQARVPIGMRATINKQYFHDFVVLLSGHKVNAIF